MQRFRIVDVYPQAEVRVTSIVTVDDDNITVPEMFTFDYDKRVIEEESPPEITFGGESYTERVTRLDDKDG